MNYERLNDLRLLDLRLPYYRRDKGMTEAELAEAYISVVPKVPQWLAR